MTEANPKCDQCGAVLPANALEGLCPFCVTQGLFGLFDEGAESGESQGELGAIGGYDLLDEIGEGGFAVVYRAQQSGDVRREVALKVIKKGMDTRQVIARFEAERQAVAMMDHADIATVFDAGTTDDGRPFFVMELVEGQTITDFCQGLELDARLKLIVRVCNAVEHAHRRGIIHRDLKPNNLLVSSGEGQLKVIDFGIAKATEHLLTESTLVTAGGQLLGTPGYMSPEQATLGRADVDTRTDVYALGVLLYEVLAGRPIWSRETLGELPVEEMLRQVREQEPPPPSKYAPGLPSDLDWITARATAKERDRRYGSAAELGADLQRFLDGEAVKARPPSSLYRLGKFVRRHRVAVIASLLVTLAVIGGAIASTLFAIQSEKRRAETAAAKDETRRNFSKADLGMARGAAAAGNYAESIAYLCRSLRTDPENSAAAQTLVHELVYRGLPQPAAEPHSTGRGAELLHALSGGHFLVVGPGGTASLWRVDQHQFRRVDVQLPEDVIGASASSGGTHFALAVSGGWRVFGLERSSVVPLASEIAPGAERVELTEDGSSLCALIDDGVAGFDTGTGDSSWRWSSGSQRISAFECSPVRDYCAVGLDDGTVVVLNRKSGRELERVNLPEGEGGVGGVKIVRSHLITFGKGGKTAYRYRLGRGQSPVKLELDEPIRSIRLNRSGELAAVATIGAVTLFDGAERLARVEAWHVDSMFDPGGEILIVQTSETQIELFDVRTGGRLAMPMEHVRKLTGLAATPTDTLATVTETGTLHLWRLSRSFPELVHFEHGDSPYGMVTFLPPGDSISTFELGGTMGTFVSESGFEASFYSDQPFLARTAFLDLTRTKLALAAPDPPPFTEWSSSEVTLQVINTTKTRQIGQDIMHTGIRQARLNDVGTLVIAGDWNGRVSLYSTATGERLHRWESVGKMGTRWIEIGPGGTYAVVAAGGNSASILHLESPFERTDVVHAGPVFNLDISPDGKLLATGSEDNTARLWHFPSGKPASAPLPHDEIAAERGIIVKFSPDNRFLISGGSGDYTARVWNSDTGVLAIDPLHHGGVVRCFEWAPDQRRLITGCDDRFTRLWDTGTGGLLAPPWRHPGPTRSFEGFEEMLSFTSDEPIRFVQFDPHSGRRFLSAAAFGGVEVYEIAPHKMALEPWFLDFAEAYGGVRFNERGVLEPLPTSELFRWREKLADLPLEEGTVGEQTAAWLVHQRRPRTPFAPWRTKGPAQKFRPDNLPWYSSELNDGVTGFSGEQ